MINSIKSILPDRWIRFFVIVLITICFTYILPGEFNVIWSVILLVLYYHSMDEAFWLVFFLITTDGFIGFFGLSSMMIQLIPGMPAIELVQLYIFLSVIKAIRSRNLSYVFYQKYLVVLFLYLIFMIAWGQLMGMSGELNVYFRLLKLTLPLLLFYSIPRLFPNIAAYKRLFLFVFIIMVLAFFTQVFTLLTGLSPAGFVYLTEEQLSEAGIFRGFSNVGATVLSLFGALVFLSYKEPVFNRFYLNTIIACAFGNAFLSASRGWIVFFSIVFLLSILFVYKFNPRQLVGIVIVFVAFFILGMDNPILKKQSDFAISRLTTLEALSRGDITAGGTLVRLSERSPRVMKKWKENPVFGWGFSDVSGEYGDGHVGNQTVLLSSGVVGFSLLIGFLLYFILRLFARFQRLSKTILNSKVYLIFIFMLLGWFFLHSSAGQQFGFGGMPMQIIPQAIFFSFGALLYAKPSELSK